MTPDLAQVLNTVAHEIRTPLAVSQGYLKLFLDGRLKEENEIRRAMEQTRQALGALATLCVDMGKVSTLAESAEARGIPVRVPAPDFVTSLLAREEVQHAAFTGSTGTAAIATASVADLAHAVAIVAKSAFDEERDEPHAIEASQGDGLLLIAGSTKALASMSKAPDAPGARAVDFGKGGKGLKLIWAAFVLDRHGVQTWTDDASRASVGFRIPLVQA